MNQGCGYGRFPPPAGDPMVGVDERRVAALERLAEAAQAWMMAKGHLDAFEDPSFEAYAALDDAENQLQSAVLHYDVTPQGPPPFNPDPRLIGHMEKGQWSPDGEP